MKTAYLYGELKQRVVVQPPEGIPSPLPGPSVWVLDRAVYGMPDSGRCWQDTFHAFMTDVGGARTKNEQCVYYFRRQTLPHKEEVLFVATSVDDLALAGNSHEFTEECEEKGLESIFDRFRRLLKERFKSSESWPGTLACTSRIILAPTQGTGC